MQQEPQKQQQPVPQCTAQEQLRQQMQQMQQPVPQGRLKRSKAIVTRVVADLMVFVAAIDDEDEIGLVFKPDKIVGYRGEPLNDLGIVVGTEIPEISWNSETLKVSSVNLIGRGSTDTPPMSQLS